MDASLPYQYLNIAPDPLLPGWETIKNLNSVFIHFDHGCTLLKPEIKNIFLNQELIPSRGNLWSWAPNSLPKYYHTDQKETATTKCELCAVNWLMSGNPGNTEWSFKALEKKVNIQGKTGLHGTEPQLWGDIDLEADVSVPLSRPMLIRTNVPHRVNNLHNDTWRIAYSVRFKGNPSWEEVFEKLSGYVL
jgi:hypothetical protein